MSSTMIERVLARASDQKQVSPGDTITARIDRVLLTNMADISETLASYGVESIWDPERVVVVHGATSAPPTNIEMANQYRRSREAAAKHGLQHFYDIGQDQGVAHMVFIEKGYAHPGELVVGDDADVTALGALNVAATPVPEIPYVLATGELWFEVPQSSRWILAGHMPDGVGAKDIALHISGLYGADVGLAKSAEFTGPTVASMTRDSRLTLASMARELGMMFTLFEVDEQTSDSPETRTLSAVTSVQSDPDATYAEAYEIDVSQLEPQVACPHAVDNVKPVEKVAGTSFQQAFLGGSHAHYEDIKLAANLIRGKQIHPEVRMIVTPGSQEIYNRMVRSGLVKLFMDAHAVVTNAGVGAEAGTHGGVLGDGEVALSTGTRNYQGRMGSLSSSIYLASSATVAASALAGHIVDPRAYL